MSVALVIVGLLLMTLLHELGHAAVARALRMHVHVISLGFGPSLWRGRWGDTDVLVCLVPFGGFVRVAELSADEQGTEPPRVALAAKLAVQIAGSGMNYLVASTLATALAVGWGVETGRVVGLEVTRASEHATAIGLRVGDVIVRADNAEVCSVEALQERFRSRGLEPVRLEVMRGAERLEMAASAASPGAIGVGARYVPKPELRAVRPTRAIGNGLVHPLGTAARLIGRIPDMLRPSAQRPASPVGLAARVAQSGKWDTRRVLSFAELLAVVVGVFNLLPIPGLDGGRVCLVLGEAVTRRRLSRRAALAVQLTGAVVLLTLWIALVVADLVSLGG